MTNLLSVSMVTIINFSCPFIFFFIQFLAADKNDLKKQAITQELYQTEFNYVTILKDILKVCIQCPLGNMKNQLFSLQIDF